MASSASARYPAAASRYPGTVGGRDMEMTDDDESEEDEETRLQREEEEDQERELTERHGEASEGRVRGEKRTAEDIEADYEKKAKASQRMKKPELTIDMLTGADGLLRLPTEFRKIPCRMQGSKSTAGAAAYSLRLIEAYKSFCFDLMPSMAFEDVLLKIEKESSGRPLKDFMTNMRNAQRNQYLEGLYGKEKATQLLTDLEGLMAAEQQDYQEEYAGAAATEAEVAVADGRAVDAATSTSLPLIPNVYARQPTVSPPVQRLAEATNVDDDDDGEKEFDFEQEEQQHDDDDDAPGANKDSSVFRDDMAEQDNVEKAANSNVKGRKRRFVLEDSSDEEDDEDMANHVKVKGKSLPTLDDDDDELSLASSDGASAMAQDDVKVPTVDDDDELTDDYASRQLDKDDYGKDGLDGIDDDDEINKQDATSVALANSKQPAQIKCDDDENKSTDSHASKQLDNQLSVPEASSVIASPTKTMAASADEDDTARALSQQVHFSMAQTQPTQPSTFPSQLMMSSTQSDETATIIGTAFTAPSLSSDEEEAEADENDDRADMEDD